MQSKSKESSNLTRLIPLDKSMAKDTENFLSVQRLVFSFARNTYNEQSNMSAGVYGSAHV